MTEEPEKVEEKEEPKPKPWEKEKPTLWEAILCLNNEALDIEEFQARQAPYQQPNHEAMRKAHVMKYVVTVLELVLHNEAAVKAAIRGNRQGGSSDRGAHKRR